MSSVISRIEKEFIFKFLIQNKINFEIKSGKNSTFATLLDQNSKELKIEFLSILDEIKAHTSELQIFFFFQNNYHAFKTNILKLKGNIAIIKNPEILLKNLQRKFNRVNINGKLKLKFIIKADLVKLNFPETNINYYPSKPPIEADFHEVSIDNILNKFKDKVSSIISTSMIKMLRNYKPQSFEEQMVIKYGKALYVPNTRGDLPQKQTIPEFQILIKSDWFRFEMHKNKTQAYLANKKISKHLKNLFENNMYSLAIFPAFYRNYIVALIILINHISAGEPISPKIMTYTHQFTRLLSYVLKENHYFKDEETNIQRYVVPIYDLSPGGLGFWHDNNFFEDRLLVNHNFQFLIEIKTREIRILAKLVRKFKKDDKFFYGFMFIDIKRNDFDFLNSYLYNE